MDPNTKREKEFRGLRSRTGEFLLRSQTGILNVRFAFTIVELLVAMAILSLLVVMTASAYQAVLAGYVRIADQSRQREEARSVLLLMSNEIRDALSPVSRSPGVVVPGMGSAAPGLDLLINPPKLSSTSDGLLYANPHTLFWQAPGRDGFAGSALVGYALKWETRPDGSPVPVLRRLQSDTGRMFKELADAASNLLISPGATWASQPLLASLAPASTASAYKGWMADFIIALWVRPLDPNGNPIINTARQITGVTAVATNNGLPASTLGNATASVGSFDSKLGYQYSSPPIDRFAPALPAAIEIAIVTLPPSMLKRITGPLRPDAAQGANSGTFWADIEAYVADLPDSVRSAAKTYSTIVPLNGSK